MGLLKVWFWLLVAAIAIGMLFNIVTSALNIPTGIW